MIILYHNKNCSKSRACLELIKNSNTKYKIIEYMVAKLNYKDIQNIVYNLQDELKDLVRVKDNKLQEKEIINFKNKKIVIDLLFKDISKLQRPIIFYNSKYIICRPVNKVLKYL